MPPLFQEAHMTGLTEYFMSELANCHFIFPTTGPPPRGGNCIEKEYHGEDESANSVRDKKTD
jgi:hypothetical protein